MPVHSALSVCKEFREVLMDSPAHMGALLTNVHGGSKETALVHACELGHEAAVRHLLQQELPGDSAPRAEHSCVQRKAGTSRSSACFWGGISIHHALTAWMEQHSCVQRKAGTSRSSACFWGGISIRHVQTAMMGMRYSTQRMAPVSRLYACSWDGMNMRHALTASGVERHASKQSKTDTRRLCVFWMSISCDMAGMVLDSHTQELRCAVSMQEGRVEAVVLGTQGGI
jgi:hypothetical protein